MEPRREIRLEHVGGLYSVPAAAKRLGISYDALDARIRKGTVLVFWLGHERLVRLSDLRLTSPSPDRRT